MIIVNADDWGYSLGDTDAVLACYQQERITSISAMVFMADSERAADIALERGIPTGLHINFSQIFSAKVKNELLSEYHARIVRFLNRSRYSLLFYSPFLGKPFRHVFQAQVAEFIRLYRKPPTHFDGHNHMHLCTNMLIAAPIAKGQKVRRSFSFGPREKGFVNRGYRALVDRWLGLRYHLTDYFFALSQQLAEERFARVCRLAQKANVELMVHPIWPIERAFLDSKEFGAALDGIPRGSYLDL